MLEEKQHDKYPAQYISRRTTRRAIAHEGDRALDLAKQKNIHKVNSRKQVKGQETEKEKNSTYNSWWH